MSKIVNINPRSYPSVGTGKETMILLGVLIQYESGHFKCYEAIVPDISVMDPDYKTVRDAVASYGRPCRLDQAKAHFPGMTAERYAS